LSRAPGRIPIWINRPSAIVRLGESIAKRPGLPGDFLSLRLNAESKKIIFRSSAVCEDSHCQLVKTRYPAGINRDANFFTGVCLEPISGVKSVIDGDDVGPQDHPIDRSSGPGSHSSQQQAFKMSILQAQVRKLVALLILVAAWMAGAAQAATETATFQVTATVPSQCTTLTTNSLAFGTYDPTAATPTDASATLSIRCSSGAAITVDLSAGSTAGATVAQRKLASGANTLNYNLYTAAARSTIWGGANTVSGTGQGLDTATSFTVYGRIPAGQTNAVPGSYSDSITVTVTY